MKEAASLGSVKFLCGGLCQRVACVLLFLGGQDSEKIPTTITSGSLFLPVGTDFITQCVWADRNTYRETRYEHQHQRGERWHLDR